MFTLTIDGVAVTGSIAAFIKLAAELPHSMKFPLRIVAPPRLLLIKDAIFEFSFDVCMLTR